MTENHSDNRKFVVDVVSAADLNPRYLECVPIFIESWLEQNRFSNIYFRPKILLVAEQIPEALTQFKKFITLLSPGALPSAFVAQASRLILPAKSTADFVITSDIDMVPLNLKFERDLINKGLINSDDFVVLRDVLPPGQFSICYNIASPNAWKSVLGIYSPGTDLLESLHNLLEMKGGVKNYSGVHGGLGWSFDQEILWQLVTSAGPNVCVKKYTDKHTQHQRLDRQHQRGLLKWMIFPLLFLGFFHDYHLHLPVAKNRRYIWLVLKVYFLGKRVRDVFS